MIRAPATIDWLGGAEDAARNEINAEDEARRRANWLSRSIDPDTHPLILALEPMYAQKDPPFPVFHRVQVVDHKVILIQINDHCALAFILIFPLVACKLGHIEPDGTVFEHMHDAAGSDGPNRLP